MDLISRKAVRFELGEVDIPKGVKEQDFYDVMSNVVDRLVTVPSVPAVPLDKLCEWMALRFGYPCQIIDDCNAWYVSECAESEAKKADCWRRVLTTWMEELDDKQ